MKLLFQSISVLFILSSNIILSQTQLMHNNYITIPDISLLDIEPNTSEIILEFGAPGEPGNQLQPIGIGTKWINYTATQSIAGIPKEITAQVSSDSNIPGISIELVVSSYVGRGSGAMGTTVGSIILSTSAQSIITGIGGCYTGTGSNNGHEIEYSASIIDYSLFELPENPNMDIIFTISN